jgi:DNA replication and repair protein RecF
MIKRIKLKDFRNYKHLDVETGNPVNILTGANGQGKTNLLEAVFFVSMLRSFRTSRINDVKNIGSGGFYAAMEVMTGKWAKTLEVEYYGGRKLKIDNAPVVKASEFIREIRTVAFSPDDATIVNGNSSLRRRFLDMFISIMLPGYMSALHVYVTALKSRNTVLKTHGSNKAMLEAYEPMLAESALFIVKQREYHLRLLCENINSILKDFYDSETVFDIKYKTDVPADLPLVMRKFSNERKKDILRGFTGFGPQLDEIDFYLNGSMMRNYASTGQCRLISLCLKMAEVNILAADSSVDPANIVVLIDDVTGELDEKSRNTFFKIISKAGQAFFTFTEKPSDNFFTDAIEYHVNNGKIY